jgi:hypothetical protein
MNIFLVLNVLNLNPASGDSKGSDSALQMMLFDKHPDGPYIDFLKQVYSPLHPVIRASHYNNKMV